MPSIKRNNEGITSNEISSFEGALRVKKKEKITTSLVTISSFGTKTAESSAITNEQGISKFLVLFSPRISMTFSQFVYIISPFSTTFLLEEINISKNSMNNISPDQIYLN